MSDWLHLIATGMNTMFGQEQNLSTETGRGTELENYAENAEGVATDVYLTFSVGDSEYAVGVANVREIIGLPSLTEIPDMPEYVKGVINLRGRIIPLIDMSLRFGNESTIEYGDRICVVIVEFGNLFAGLIVDTVNEVLRISENQLEVAPRFAQDGGRQHRLVSAVGKSENGVKLVIDLQGILDDQSRLALESDPALAMEQEGVAS